MQWNADCLRFLYDFKIIHISVYHKQSASSAFHLMSFRKTNTQKLGDAIKEMLRLEGIDEKIDEHLLVRSWEKTVGPLISKHTTEIFISGKRLFVKVDSSPLKQELQYSKTKLMKDLNELVGKVVIEEIVLK